MERYRKKQLLKTMDLLEQANMEVSSMNKCQQSEATDILIQCQELALEIGNCLEMLGEPGKTIVPMLEDYCDNLYQISQFFENREQYKKLTQIIKSQLHNIKEQMCRELPKEKKEIVFLPYKASMWDSLESVWKAAAKDVECDAYVVPIPYFDRNPDGTLGQIHYEGEQYPKDIPITYWEDYHLEERHPDVVYIHNPYDQCNYVTSVHPAYYSSRLKQFTDMLIYIPYFVATAHHVEEHFCTLPGVFYADRVILEDEEIRKFYIEQFHKYEQENHCQGLFGKAEEKFLALGSPKFDKVLSTKREDVKVPVEWNRILYREDGVRKKVVFYNTTIDALLKEETYIEKIRSVLKVFYENRNEIVLFWRPHPLNMATMQAMRPQKFPEYEKLVADYKAAGYGIYDDTPDLHRAIALSDAYYGDWSSVVSLYEKTGKPIMIQNTECLERAIS